MANIAREWQGIINDKVKAEQMIYNQLQRDEFYKALSKKADWLGTSSSGSDKRSIVVNFMAGGVGSVRMGGYADIANVQKAKPVKALVQSYKDLTMTLNFNEKDLEDFELGSSEYEKAVMVSVAKQLEGQAQVAKNYLEDQFINGGVILNVTSIANASTGILVVDRPEKVNIGDNLQLAAATASSTKNKVIYVIGVNKNTKAVTFSTSQGGTATDISTYVGSSAAGTKIAVEGTVNSSGVIDGAFDSVRNILLPYANGGAESYLGLVKTAYPFLQSVAVDGSGFSTSSLLQDLFEAWAGEIKLKVKPFKGKKTNAVHMSTNNYLKICEQFEYAKGSFRKNDATTLKVFDGDAMTISNSQTGGELSFVCLDSMPDDIMYGLNMESWRFACNKELSYRKGIQPSGLMGYSWFESRTAGDNGGYTHTLDGGTSGQIVCGSPESNFVIHSVNL